jgi:uncharacterized protein (TIGR02452 family)
MDRDDSPATYPPPTFFDSPWVEVVGASEFPVTGSEGGPDAAEANHLAPGDSLEPEDGATLLVDEKPREACESVPDILVDAGGHRKPEADEASALGTDESHKRKADAAAALVPEDSRKQFKFDDAHATRAVIEDTLDLCEQNGFLAKKVIVWNLPGTQDMIQPDVPEQSPRVHVHNADCVRVATELAKKKPGANVWLLHMANAVKPACSVGSGQANHLGRCSDLLPQLDRAKSEGKYPLHTYDNRRTVNKWFSVLVHNEVTIFKDPDNYSTLPREAWSKVGVLTAAAECMKDERTRGPNALRFIMYLLEVATAQKCSHLVLSAWGCGALGQDAKDVALCFRQALQNVDYKLLPEVVFAIPDDPTIISKNKGRGNLDIFKAVFTHDGPVV